MSDTLIQTTSDTRLFGRGRRVRWVAWDSSFREAGLRPGDVLVGDHGERYTAEDLEQQRVIGGGRESMRLQHFGTGRGDPITLLVERDGQVVELEGRLTGHTTYRDADGKRCLGEGGPSMHAKDGYDYAWSPWYDRFRTLAERILIGWDHSPGYDTRRLAKEMDEFTERVAALELEYPSTFATRVREDHDAMVAMLAGELRTLSEEDLAYREPGQGPPTNHARLQDGQSPAEVLGVMLESLEQDDFDTWLSCFADWTIRSSYKGSDSHEYVDLSRKVMGPTDAPSIWKRSRARVLDDVYGLEVASVSEPRVVYEAAQQPPGSVEPVPAVVREVHALVDHIGRFGDEYRTFASGTLHRTWTLEQLDDGPWRITRAQAI